MKEEEVASVLYVGLILEKKDEVVLPVLKVGLILAREKKVSLILWAD